MKKWNSISVKLRVVVIIITMLSILIAGIVALSFIVRIKQRSEIAVTNGMRNNVSMFVDEKVGTAESSLNYYSNYIDMAVSLAELIHKNPDKYIANDIPTRDANAKEEYLLQKSYTSNTVNKEAVKIEMSELANLISVWSPMMTKDGETVVTAYIGTETGFMISYDKNASLAEYSADGEVYFDHKGRNWYINAKKAGKLIFTDLTQDYFGRGLSLTCAKPFYYDEKFAGVVGMDILIDDLQKSIIDIDVEKNYTSDYAFLVNNDGDIIASPFVNKDTTEFENITNPSSIFYPISESILKEKKGIKQVNDFYCVYSPIEIADWVLCVYVPQEIILDPVKNLDKTIRTVINVFVILMFILGAIAFVVIRVVSKKITNPILALKNDVDIISKGDLDYKARVIGNDEISDLANSFNNMTGSLKNYINDLTSLTAEKERIGAELNVATHIQSSMLPSIFPAFPHDARFDIFATMNPAKEVGGDFYDFFKVDEKHLAMVVADVSGKGVPAALFMVIGKTLIKDHTNLNTYLSDTFYEVNNMLCESNSENLFITAFEAVINVETGHMKFVNAGHEMPFIYRKGSWTAEKIKPGFVLAGMENMKFASGELYLEKGDKFFQYTDGVTEATNANNELYGMERLEKVLNENGDKDVHDLLPAVKADIDKFVGDAPQFDDITMLGFELR